MNLSTLTTIICVASATAASANEFVTEMQSFVDENVLEWANDPILVAAIRAQNDSTQLLPQATIDEMDAVWRAQASSSCGGVLLDVLSNPAAAFMRDQIARTDGAITESLLMDARGMNVAATHATSDYWQGDEAKFQETFLIGPDGIHFSEIELDESTNEVQGQVSFTITDHATGQPIGALTVGIKLTALM